MVSGRGRGRSLNPTRSTSRRGSRSDSRRASSRTGTRGSLRRSARLANQANAEPGISTAGTSMAHVARRSQPADRLGTRAIDADFTRDRSRHRARRGRLNENVEPYAVQPVSRQNSYQQPGLDADELRYGMDIVVQPPPVVRSGSPLQPSLTVRLRCLTPGGDDAATVDSTNLVAVATLTTDSDMNGSPDPTELTAILAGRRFDSIHPFTEEEMEGLPFAIGTADARGVGYVSFPDLVIRREGIYRIRITLIRIRSSTGEAPANGGSSVQVIDSNAITVQGSGGASTPLGLDSGKQTVAIF